MTKRGGGINSGGPDTDDMVTRSPLPTVSTGASLASKNPQWTVAGPASTRGMSGGFGTRFSDEMSAHATRRG
jgi:hypothetical protein